MNKIKVSKAEMRDNDYIISIGYGDLQYLLRYESPFAYSSGECGWNCDYYNIDGVIISAGYSPLRDKNVNFDYNIVKKYEEKAGNIIKNYDIPYEKQRKNVKKLLSKFIEECKEVNS